MSDDPTNFPEPATAAPAPEEPSDVRTILLKGHTVIIDGKVFTLCMNAVVMGTRSNIVAAGLKPE